MELIVNCIICKSERLSPYSMRFMRGFPHLSRVKCRDCGVVFANPVASDAELHEFYQNYYDKGNFALLGYKELHRSKFAKYSDEESHGLAANFSYVLDHKKAGNFLDIGFGLGEPLFLADKFGFQVFGTEYDDDAISFVKSHISDGSFHKGDIFDAPWQSETFDFIRFWHVIEHVKDPRAYMEKVFKLLKPGGVLMIGTPNISCLAYKVLRGATFLSFRIPAIVDGLEHTVLFSKKTLRNLTNEYGFEVVKHFAHGNGVNYAELLKENIPLKKKVVIALQSVWHVSQTLYLRRPNQR